MAKHSTSSASQQALLDSKEWKSIQDMVQLHGVSTDNPMDNPWLPLSMWWLLRKRERALPENHRLPNEIAQMLCQILRSGGFKKFGRREQYDPEEIARFMQQILEDGKAKGEKTTLVAASMSAQEKFGCAASSAEKWFYEWRKKASG